MQPSTNASSGFYSLKATTIDGKPFSFEELRDKKVLIVNTASACGFTKQYKKLQELFDRFKDRNFVILGFPSNDFGEQEKGDAGSIQEFCSVNFGVTFTLFEKTHIIGDQQHPVYQWLTQKKLNGKQNSKVYWNFQKYMISENGELIDFLYPFRSPLCGKIIRWVEK
ncbi:MAG: glutathione peroxidase [Sphingobacteriaceae bacterium]|jgi:glutathione peroxidase